MYTIITAKRLSNGAPGQDIFTKAGSIRKDCKQIEIDGTPEQVRDYLDTLGWEATGRPYFFAYIDGVDAAGNRSIITQSVNGLPCSPVRLAELLGV